MNLLGLLLLLRQRRTSSVKAAQGGLFYGLISVRETIKKPGGGFALPGLFNAFPKEIKLLPYVPAAPASVPASRSAVRAAGCFRAPLLHGCVEHSELPVTGSCSFLSALQFPFAAA